MAFLAVQIGITLCDIGGIAVIEIRIQVPDARTVNAHVIAEAQVGHIRQLPADAGGRDYVVKVFLEVLASAQKVFHILYGMLVAYAQSAGQLFYLQRITGISSQDVIQMLVVRTMVFIEFIIGLLPCATLKAVVLGTVVAKDIFSSGLNGVHLADRSSIIRL